MTSSEPNLETAAHLKEEGNKNFQSGNFQLAATFYTKAIECTREDTLEKSVYYKNRAAAYIKLNDFEKAVKDADKALEISPRDPKALFRRCQALESLERYS